MQNGLIQTFLLVLAIDRAAFKDLECSQRTYSGDYPCRGSFMEVGSKMTCIQISTKYLSWNSAKGYCPTKDAQLLVARPEILGNMTATPAVKTALSSIKWGAWVGLQESKKNSNKFYWYTDPTTLPQLKWAPGQPKRWRNKRCGYVDMDGLLRSDDCSRRKLTFCSHEIGLYPGDPIVSVDRTLAYEKPFRATCQTFVSTWAKLSFIIKPGTGSQQEETITDEDDRVNVYEDQNFVMDGEVCKMRSAASLSVSKAPYYLHGGTIACCRTKPPTCNDSSPISIQYVSIPTKIVLEPEGASLREQQEIKVTCEVYPGAEYDLVWIFARSGGAQILTLRIGRNGNLFALNPPNTWQLLGEKGAGGSKGPSGMVYQGFSISHKAAEIVGPKGFRMESVISFKATLTHNGCFFQCGTMEAQPFVTHGLKSSPKINIVLDSPKSETHVPKKDPSKFPGTKDVLPEGRQTGKDASQRYPTGKDPNQQHPTEKYISEGHQTGKGPNQGHQTGKDPSQGHQTGKDPSQGHQTGKDPSQGHQTGKDPSQGHQTGKDPSQGHQTGKDPSQGHQTGKYPSRNHQTGKGPNQGHQTEKDPSQHYQTGKYPSQGLQTGEDPSQNHQAGEGLIHGYLAGNDSSQGHHTGNDSSQDVQAAIPSGFGGAVFFNAVKCTKKEYDDQYPCSDSVEFEDIRESKVCMRIETEAMESFDSAKSICDFKYTGFLARITDKELDGNLTKSIEGAPEKLPGFWIGLHNRKNKGRYTFQENDQKAKWFNWDVGQPTGSRRCVMKNRANGKWVSSKCDEKLGYICEKVSARNPGPPDLNVDMHLGFNVVYMGSKLQSYCWAFVDRGGKIMFKVSGDRYVTSIPWEDPRMKNKEGEDYVMDSNNRCMLRARASFELDVTTELTRSRITCCWYRTRQFSRCNTSPKILVYYQSRRPELYIEWHEQTSFLFNTWPFDANCTAFVGTRGELHWILRAGYGEVTEWSIRLDGSTFVKRAGGDWEEQLHEYFNYTTVKHETGKSKELGPWIKSTFHTTVSFKLDGATLTCDAHSIYDESQNTEDKKVTGLPFSVIEWKRPESAEFLMEAAVMMGSFLLLLALSTCLICTFIPVKKKSRRPKKVSDAQMMHSNHGSPSRKEPSGSPPDLGAEPGETPVDDLSTIYLSREQEQVGQTAVGTDALQSRSEPVIAT